MTISSKAEIEQMISDTVESFPHDACRSCECFLGLVVQLDLDSDSSHKSFLNAFKPEPGEIHACLGCDPCPSGDRYGDYIRRKQQYRV